MPFVLGVDEGVCEAPDEGRWTSLSSRGADRLEVTCNGFVDGVPADLLERGLDALMRDRSHEDAPALEQVVMRPDNSSCDFFEQEVKERVIHRRDAAATRARDSRPCSLGRLSSRSAASKRSASYVGIRRRRGTGRWDIAHRARQRRLRSNSMSFCRRRIVRFVNAFEPNDHTEKLPGLVILIGLHLHAFQPLGDRRFLSRLDDHLFQGLQVCPHRFSCCLDR